MASHDHFARLDRPVEEHTPELRSTTGGARTVTVLRCTAVLFDCDGVLVDSDTAVVRSWTRWAHEMNLDPEEVLPTVYGRRSVDTVAQFVSPSKRPAAVELIDALEIEDAATATAIPGAAELLAAIPAGRWATVTSASRDLAHARLSAAGLTAPEVLVTAGDVRHGKPHPEGYLAAAQRIGVPADQCVVVEDAPAGIRAARAAQVGHVLGVGSRDIGEHQPDAVVPDLRSVHWTSAGLEIQ
ncbi:HAD-IA family hydrolase [Pseudarthrobacter sp. AL07]|uniref:HAD-IA family hydrolase n=1 Tax=unclassified Pseudarthrobacter TaxID=2647000 RepID=UPI00249B3468|nr:MULTISPECIES: HAD-IA family hydrolase [unclassified Pseudarthrobacter]MDI3196031.1 HAD-IA family hydrolase [Pseudarthrobacter sp. AL20]MDI3210102.1 HAD-IA family hydrolase [Pseudarthrobacter sp. AL07]